MKIEAIAVDIDGTITDDTRKICISAIESLRAAEEKGIPTIIVTGNVVNYAYAAEVLTKQLLKEAKGFWLKDIGLVFRWTGMARDWVFKAINEIGVIDIQYIKEETPIQFGWCKWLRPKRN